MKLEAGVILFDIGIAKKLRIKLNSASNKLNSSGEINVWCKKTGA